MHIFREHNKLTDFILSDVTRTCGVWEGSSPPYTLAKKHRGWDAGCYELRGFCQGRRPACLSGTPILNRAAWLTEWSMGRGQFYLGDSFSDFRSREFQTPFGAHRTRTLNGPILQCWLPKSSRMFDPRRKETFQELNFDACGLGSNSNFSASLLVLMSSATDHVSDRATEVDEICYHGLPSCRPRCL